MSHALLMLVLAAPRVALVGGEARLEQALSVSLLPWKVEVVVVDAAPPGSSMPDAQQAAARVASVNDAAAVVWTAGADVLWIYDRQHEQLVTRRMPPQEPDARAAAAALSVKTVLRASDLAPPEERLVVSRTSWLRLEAVAGARIFSDSAEARFGGALSAWRGPFGVAAGAEVGTGLDLAQNGFSGRFSDTALLANVRARWAGRWVGVEGLVGPAVHVTSIDGALAGMRSTARRTDVAVTTAALLDVRLGARASVGLFAGIDSFLRRQRYLAAGQPVLELSQVAVQLGLRVTAGLLE